MLQMRIKNENEQQRKMYHVRKHLTQHEIITYLLNHHKGRKRRMNLQIKLQYQLLKLR